MTTYNKNFGRIDENGNIEYAPIPLPLNGNTWTNSEEIHLECGYYPLVSTERPLNDGTHYYTSYYVLEDNKIMQKWEEHEIEPIKAEVEGTSVPTA